MEHSQPLPRSAQPMHRRAGRWLGRALGGLAAILALAALATYATTELRASRVYDTPLPAVAASADPAVVLRGQRLVHTLLVCTDCHGENLAGKGVIEDPAIGYVYSANLTGGRGGVSGSMSDGELARAIRHGVSADGHSLWVMSVEDYNALSREDLVAVLSYLRTLPSVDNELPPNRLGPLGRVLLATGQANLFSAETVPQHNPFEAPPAPGVNAEHGYYLARTAGCMGCHGATLSGGRIPGSPPDFPTPANITPGGETRAWTDADWFRAIREGKRPGGDAIDPFMPTKAYAGLTDEEVRALIAFLRGVPAKEFGGR